MAIKSPVEKKNFAIPKYQGYIPGSAANNELGRCFTKVTRRCFDAEKLDNKPNLFASTGFNFKTLTRTDSTLEAWTYKHGKGTMPRPHPCQNEGQWSTTARKCFQKP